jgi:hypothetical protein
MFGAYWKFQPRSGFGDLERCSLEGAGLWLVVEKLHSGRRRAKTDPPAISDPDCYLNRRVVGEVK